MKKKFLKNIGIIALAMAICFLPQISAMASIMYNGNQTIFLNQFVDSNQWTYVCSTSYAYGKDEVEVTLFNIYKDDGSTSNYKRVKVNACIDGILHGAKKWR